MIFKVLSQADLEQIRIWRNAVPATLRTPYLLTEEMQAEYFRNTISDRKSNMRYWGFWDAEAKVIMGGDAIQNGTLLGYGGIENIQWESRIGEISLLIAPKHRRKGYGKEAVELILKKAWNELNLSIVYGECYQSGSYVFWQKILKWREPTTFSAWLPARKYWKGRYWNSLYFTFFRSKELR